MFPLVFRMALPAVAAQIANLLYGIVDRIFIGHIPGIGTDAQILQHLHPFLPFSGSDTIFMAFRLI